LRRCAASSPSSAGSSSKVGHPRGTGASGDPLEHPKCGTLLGNDLESVNRHLHVTSLVRHKGIDHALKLPLAGRSDPAFGQATRLNVRSAPNTVDGLTLCTVRRSLLVDTLSIRPAQLASRTPLAPRMQKCGWTGHALANPGTAHGDKPEWPCEDLRSRRRHLAIA
jgi:hypothetical protein